MRLHRFFVQTDLSKRTLRIDELELVNQWRNVLRLKEGAGVFLFDGSGAEAKAKILSFGSRFAELEVVENFENKNEPERHVILYCSVLKRENFELVAQKATEIGVKEIMPIVAERTEKLNLRTDRLERIAKEAAEQSGRAIVPKIHEPIEFEKAIEKARENCMNLFFDKAGDEIKKKPFAISPKPFAVWIGPEGGWTEAELGFVEKVGFRKVSLGKLTLRAETAAIVASHLVVWNFPM